MFFIPRLLRKMRLVEVRKRRMIRQVDRELDHVECGLRDLIDQTPHGGERIRLIDDLNRIRAHRILHR